MRELNKIMMLSARFLDIPVSAFTTPNRSRKYAEARFMLMGILHNSFKMTLVDTGSVTGRNHATVIHGLRKLKDLREAYPEINQKYLKLKEYIYENGLNERVKFTGYCYHSTFEIKIGKSI